MIDENSIINFYLSPDQSKEAENIKNILTCLEENSINDVAILVRERNMNTSIILDCLQESNIAIYNGLFNQNDFHYQDFHNIVLPVFNGFIENKRNKSFTKMISYIL